MYGCICISVRGDWQIPMSALSSMHSRLLHQMIKDHTHSSQGYQIFAPCRLLAPYSLQSGRSNFYTVSPSSSCCLEAGVVVDISSGLSKSRLTARVVLRSFVKCVNESQITPRLCVLTESPMESYLVVLTSFVSTLLFVRVFYAHDIKRLLWFSTSLFWAEGIIHSLYKSVFSACDLSQAPLCGACMVMRSLVVSDEQERRRNISLRADEGHNVTKLGISRWAKGPKQ